MCFFSKLKFSFKSFPFRKYYSLKLQKYVYKFKEKKCAQTCAILNKLILKIGYLKVFLLKKLQFFC